MGIPILCIIVGLFCSGFFAGEWWAGEGRDDYLKKHPHYCIQVYVDKENRK